MAYEVSRTITEDLDTGEFKFTGSESSMREDVGAEAAGAVSALESQLGTAAAANTGTGDDMLARVQGHTDAINRIIADEYLPRRDALLS